MRLIFWIAIILAFSAVAQAGKVKGKFQVEEHLFSKSSPIKLLMEGLIENGSNTELSTYIKVFNQVFPLLKAFTDAVDPTRGEAIKTYKYEWCWRTDGGQTIGCFDLIWNFIIGWRADQFHDDKRFYNLTISPYAYMDVTTNVTTSTDPIQFNVGLVSKLVNFRAPLSFEMQDKDTLCYSGSLSVSPIILNAGVGLKFLECELMIPEDTHTCDWTERLGASFFYRELNEGYQTVLLDRTCVKSG
jgi:hypothetical protein